MIGIYDIETLSVTQDRAEIDFIDIADADNRHTVTVTTSRQVGELHDNLAFQLRHGISTLGGPATSLSGHFIMNAGRADEGVLMPSDGGVTRAVPIKLQIDQRRDHVPNRCFMTAIGHMSEGAMIAERAAVCEIAPSPEITASATNA